MQSCLLTVFHFHFQLQGLLAKALISWRIKNLFTWPSFLRNKISIMRNSAVTSDRVINRLMSRPICPTASLYRSVDKINRTRPYCTVACLLCYQKRIQRSLDSAGFTRRYKQIAFHCMILVYLYFITVKISSQALDRKILRNQFSFSEIIYVWCWTNSISI